MSAGLRYYLILADPVLLRGRIIVLFTPSSRIKYLTMEKRYIFGML